MKDIPSVTEGCSSRDEEAAAWCLRMAESVLTQPEQKHFQEWIADGHNQKAFEEAVAVWQGMDAAAERPELIHLRTQALQGFREINSRRWQRRRPVRWQWSVAAVASLALVALATVLLMRDRAQVYETGIGERRIVRLTDGSQLSLDALTRVEVKFAESRRELRLLAGRAKFDVAKDPLRPFGVRVGDEMVVAIGTSFSVELLKSQIHLVLYEGRVEVLQKVSDTAGFQPMHIGGDAVVAEAELTPGRELLISAASREAAVVAADLSRSLSWESGQLNFVNEPLDSAVERMNRYSQERLVVADDGAATFKVNGVFNAGDTRAFVEAVTTFAPVVTVERDGQLMLRSKSTLHK